MTIYFLADRWFHSTESSYSTGTWRQRAFTPFQSRTFSQLWWLFSSGSRRQHRADDSWTLAGEFTAKVDRLWIITRKWFQTERLSVPTASFSTHWPFPHTIPSRYKKWTVSNSTSHTNCPHLSSHPYRHYRSFWWDCHGLVTMLSWSFIYLFSFFLYWILIAYYII